LISATRLRRQSRVSTALITCGRFRFNQARKVARHGRSIGPVAVSRGPSIASTIIAIDAAAELDAKARQEREKDARQRHDEAWQAVARRPERIALQGGS